MTANFNDIVDQRINEMCKKIDDRAKMVYSIWVERQNNQSQENLKVNSSNDNGEEEDDEDMGHKHNPSNENELPAGKPVTKNDEISLIKVNEIVHSRCVERQGKQIQENLKVQENLQINSSNEDGEAEENGQMDYASNLNECVEDKNDASFEHNPSNENKLPVEKPVHAIMPSNVHQVTPNENKLPYAFLPSNLHQVRGPTSIKYRVR